MIPRNLPCRNCFPQDLSETSGIPYWPSCDCGCRLWKDMFFETLGAVVLRIVDTGSEVEFYLLPTSWPTFEEQLSNAWAGPSPTLALKYWGDPGASWVDFKPYYSLWGAGGIDALHKMSLQEVRTYTGDNYEKTDWRIKTSGGMLALSWTTEDPQSTPFSSPDGTLYNINDYRETYANFSPRKIAEGLFFPLLSGEGRRASGDWATQINSWTVSGVVTRLNSTNGNLYGNIQLVGTNVIIQLFSDSEKEHLVASGTAEYSDLPITIILNEAEGSGLFVDGDEWSITYTADSVEDDNLLDIIPYRNAVRVDLTEVDLEELSYYGMIPMRSYNNRLVNWYFDTPDDLDDEPPGAGGDYVTELLQDDTTYWVKLKDVSDDEKLPRHYGRALPGTCVDMVVVQHTPVQLYAEYMETTHLYAQNEDLQTDLTKTDALRDVELFNVTCNNCAYKDDPVLPEYKFYYSLAVDSNGKYYLSLYSDAARSHLVAQGRSSEGIIVVGSKNGSHIWGWCRPPATFSGEGEINYPRTWRIRDTWNYIKERGGYSDSSGHYVMPLAMTECQNSQQPPPCNNLMDLPLSYTYTEAGFTIEVVPKSIWFSGNLGTNYADTRIDPGADYPATNELQAWGSRRVLEGYGTIRPKVALTWKNMVLIRLPMRPEQFNITDSGEPEGGDCSFTVYLFSDHTYSGGVRVTINPKAYTYGEMKALTQEYVNISPYDPPYESWLDSGLRAGYHNSPYRGVVTVTGVGTDGATVNYSDAAWEKISTWNMVDSDLTKTPGLGYAKKPTAAELLLGGHFGLWEDDYANLGPSRYMPNGCNHGQPGKVNECSLPLPYFKHPPDVSAIQSVLLSTWEDKHFEYSVTLVDRYDAQSGQLSLDAGGAIDKLAVYAEYLLRWDGGVRVIYIIAIDADTQLITFAGGAGDDLPTHLSNCHLSGEGKYSDQITLEVYVNGYFETPGDYSLGHPLMSISFPKSMFAEGGLEDYLLSHDQDELRDRPPDGHTGLIISGGSKESPLWIEQLRIDKVDNTHYLFSYFIDSTTTFGPISSRLSERSDEETGVLRINGNFSLVVQTNYYIELHWAEETRYSLVTDVQFNMSADQTFVTVDGGVGDDLPIAETSITIHGQTHQFIYNDAGMQRVEQCPSVDKHAPLCRDGVSTPILVITFSGVIDTVPPGAVPVSCTCMNYPHYVPLRRPAASGHEWYVPTTITQTCGAGIDDNWLFESMTALLTEEDGISYLTITLVIDSLLGHEWKWKKAFPYSRPDCTAISLTLTSDDQLTSPDTLICDLSNVTILVGSVNDMDFLGTQPNFFPRPLRLCKLCDPCGDAPTSLLLEIRTEGNGSVYCLDEVDHPCAPLGIYGQIPDDCCCDGCAGNVGSVFFEVRHSLLTANDGETIALANSLGLDILARLYADSCGDCYYADIFPMPNQMTPTWIQQWDYIFVMLRVVESGGQYTVLVDYELHSPLGGWYGHGYHIAFGYNYFSTACSGRILLGMGNTNCCHYLYYVTF